MRLLLLGTGGADGVPAIYGDTEVSKFARENGGRDVRSRAAALVDDALKIDLGPDTLYQIHREKLDARDWSAILFTHSDHDHFALEELQYALFPFNDMEYVGFEIFGNDVVCRAVMDRYPAWPFDMTMTKSFCPFEHDGYRILPVRANHKPPEDCHNFLISDGKSTLLYATDTGIWPDRTWDALSEESVDCLVIECSEGFNSTAYEGHLDAPETLSVVARLRVMGVLGEGSLVFTTHHSHTGGATHAMLEEYFVPHGIYVGYDGLSLEF